jgi:hypothetical protein
MTVPNQIADMHRAIGRMEGKLDSVLEERKAERDDDRAYEEFVCRAERRFMKPVGSLRPSLADLQGPEWLPQGKAPSAQDCQSPDKATGI